MSGAFHNSIPLTGITSIDTSAAFWLLKDYAPGTQTIVISAPTLALGDYDMSLRVFMRDTVTSHLATFYQPDGIRVIGSMGGSSRTWVDSASITHWNGWFEVAFTQNAGLWALVGYGGSFAPAAAAF